MDNLKPISLTYGLGADQVFNDRFKRVSSIQKGISADEIDFSILDKIKECDCDELSNIIDNISSIIDSNISFSKFISLVSLLNGIGAIINMKKCYSSVSKSLESLIEKVITIYNSFCSNPDIDTDSISDAFNKCISSLRSIIYESKNIHEKADVISYKKLYEIETNPCNEAAAILSTTSGKIYSETNPNGTTIFGRSNTFKHPDEMLNEILISESDEELIVRLPNIKKYFDRYKLNIDGDSIVKIWNVIKYVYNRLITNNTGLRKLRSELNDLSSILDTSKIDDFTSYDSIELFKEFIDKYITKIQNRIASNENDNVEYENDIMTEFGFGFIYKYPEDMSLDEAVSFTNELNSIPNKDIYEYMSLLQESIREMKKEDKYRRKQEKKEKKYREKEEKKEQKKRDRDTIKYGGRVLTLTNATARNAINSIKRIIRGITIGGPVAVVCPQMGVFVGAMVILGGFCRSKLTPLQEKKRCILDLKAELEVIEHKIDEMDRAGDVKNKAQLIRMKQRMEELYNRFSYTLTSREMI